MSTVANLTIEKVTPNRFLVKKTFVANSKVARCGRVGSPLGHLKLVFCPKLRHIYIRAGG